MRFSILFCLLLICRVASANYIFIPMDEKQTDHLKAYGIAYWILKKDTEVDWLLNYRGGSFMTKYHPAIQNELVVRGVGYEIISDAQANQIITESAKPAATPASTGTCSPVVWVSSPPVSANTAFATCSGSTSRLRMVRWA